MTALDIFACIWFLSLWVGYSRFAHRKARQGSENISFVMNRLRTQWIAQLCKREARISDAAIIANLERSVTFLASSSMLIIAGLLTAITATDALSEVLVDIPFYDYSSSYMLHIKFAGLLLIFIYAFFTFSWSMRQYGFASVVIGAAPNIEDVEEMTESELETFNLSASRVIDLAAHTYNYGLRAYYFSLSMLAWFVNAWLFIAASTIIVAVLYSREFHSKPLQHLRKIYQNKLIEDNRKIDDSKG